MCGIERLQYYDQESQLHYNYFRSYDPSTGRYVEADPIGLGGGTNLYGYASGNPSNKTDSQGLYTEYWGGAGLDGAYIDDQIQALSNAGIQNVVRGRNSRGPIWDAQAVTQLRLEKPYGLSYAFGKEPYGSCTAAADEQLNYVGYSYGSLLAAHTANFYANAGYYVNNLVLIGSPIDEEFLGTLRKNPSIGNVIVKNLADGDPIEAGMSTIGVMLSVPVLAWQQAQGKGAGHFYYAPNTPQGAARRRDLAEELYRAGLR